MVRHMTYKTNIASTSRVQYVLLEGNDNDSGFSLETAKATIAAAITTINNFVPPPTPTDPSALIISASGNFSESVTLAGGVSLDAKNISLGPLTSPVLSVGAVSNIDVFQVGTSTNSATCVLLSNVTSATVAINNIFVIGTGSIGFEVSNNTSEARVTFNDLSCFGDSSTGISNISDSISPLVFNGQDLLLRQDNAVGVQHTPTLAGSELAINISYIGDFGTQLNTTAIICNEGILSGVVGRISAVNAIVVNGGVCNLIASCISGDITVGVGATLNCDVPDYNGTITNNGTINGRLGTETYGDARVIGNLVIDGDLNVNGTLTAINTENLLVANNNIVLNAGLIDTVLQTGGVVVNHGSTGTSDTVTAGAFVAGVNGVSNPTVITVGLNTFTTGQFIQISGTLNEENDGIYEVLSHVGNVLTPRGVGLTDTVEFFSRRDFVANASDNATIINADIGVLRSDTTGGFEIAGGTSTPLTYIGLGTGDGDVTGPGPTVTNNALTLFDGTGGLTIKSADNATFDGNILLIDQILGTEDIGLRLRDQASANLIELFWDDSNIRGNLNITGNATISSSVQLAISGGAETNLTAGLNLGLSSTSGTFVTTAITDQFPLSIVNSGTNGARNDFYCYDTTPEGNLSADFGYSFCIVRDTVTPTNNGLWLLDTALNNQNTPWVQIASTSHTQDAVTSITSPSVNFALAAYSGTSGDVIQESGTTTDADGNLLFTAPAALNVGLTWQDASQSNPAQLTYNDNTKGFFFDAPFGPMTIDCGTALNIESINNDITLTAETQVNVVSAVADNVPAMTVTSQGTNGALMSLLVGNRDPQNNVTGGQGRFYFRQGVSNFESELYLSDAGSINNWVSCKGGPSVMYWGDANVQTNTTTRYLTPGWDAGSAPTSPITLSVGRRGFFQGMVVFCDNPNGNGNPVVYTLRVNQSLTPLSVTLNSNTAKGSNTGTRVDVNAFDEVDIIVTKAAGIGSNIDPKVTINFY